MAKRSTAAQVEQRLTQVTGFLLSGVSRSDILQFASKSKWGVTERQVDNYIADATQRIKDSATLDKEYLLARSISRLDSLYKKAVTDKDTRAALAVEAKIIELFGLAEAAKIDIDMDFGDLQGAMDRWRDSIQSMRKSKGDAPKSE